MDAGLDPLEAIFQKVEEESERRTRAEEEAKNNNRSDVLVSPNSRTKSRRRGSVSISRLGSLPSTSTDRGDGSRTPMRMPSIPSIPTRSNFYRAEAKNGSTDSFATDTSREVNSEEEHHVTHMQTIAGRETLPRALSRHLSRTRSRNLATEANVVIGVSVEEATVTSEGSLEATAPTTFVSGGLRNQPSRASLVPGSKWAKKLTQKFRRKSKGTLLNDSLP